MKIGVVFPQHEVGSDPGFVRDFAIAAEELRFDHIVAYEHVAGADPAHHELSGSYTHESTFHEPFVMFGYMAAITNAIDFWFGVLVLPQRQTALVAKQTATLDILSGGRVVLGVGVGWSQVEYAILGQDFSSRGRRIAEQIPLLRRLWADPLVDFDGAFDQISHAGISPRPAQEIPIWIGGWANPVLRRVGRIGDGWLAWPHNGASSEQAVRSPVDLTRNRLLIEEAARVANRDPSTIGTAVAISTIGTSDKWDPGRLADQARQWETAGATHAAVATVWAGMDTLAQHFDAIQAFRKAYG